jgi:hypothetical protein
VSFGGGWGEGGWGGGEVEGLGVEGYTVGLPSSSTRGFPKPNDCIVLLDTHCSKYTVRMHVHRICILIF